MTSENRLDAMVDALRRVEPTLDDVTRARVGADVQAALRDPPLLPWPQPVRRAVPLARWAPLAGAAAGLAAAAALVMWARTSSSPLGTPAPAAAAIPVLASGQSVEVATGATARVTIGAADVTVYGPGRIESHLAGSLPGAAVDADAVLVDRSTGDGEWSLRYGTLEVRATHATFALDREHEARVTVMRGELMLLCPTGQRAVHAGETATCAPVVTASRPRAPAEPPAPPLRVAPHRRVPEPAPAPPADPYAAADDAMRRGDRPAARAALAALLAARPGDIDAAAALLDLARLDAADGDPAGALRHLDALAAHPHGAKLADPAAHLLARLATAQASSDCAAAAPLFAAYLARFPTAADTAAVTAWRDRCAAH